MGSQYGTEASIQEEQEHKTADVTAQKADIDPEASDVTVITTEDTKEEPEQKTAEVAPERYNKGELLECGLKQNEGDENYILWFPVTVISSESGQYTVQTLSKEECKAETIYSQRGKQFKKNLKKLNEIFTEKYALPPKQSLFTTVPECDLRYPKATRRRLQGSSGRRLMSRLLKEKVRVANLA